MEKTFLANVFAHERFVVGGEALRAADGGFDPGLSESRAKLGGFFDVLPENVVVEVVQPEMEVLGDVLENDRLDVEVDWKSHTYFFEHFGVLFVPAHADALALDPEVDGGIVVADVGASFDVLH